MGCSTFHAGFHTVGISLTIMKAQSSIILALACVSISAAQSVSLSEGAKKDLDQAIALEKKKDWNGAIEAAKKAVEEDPELLAAHDEFREGNAAIVL